MKLKKFIRRLLSSLVATFGTRIVDERTGKPVARAFIFCWGGRIYIIGYDGTDQVMPVFLPQERISFWKRKIGFTTHPPPDFPKEYRPGSAP